MKAFWRKKTAAAAAILLVFCAVLGSGIMAAAAVETKAAAKEETAKTETQETYEDAGFYEMTTMTSGEESLDFTELKEYGLRSGLVLKDDGTGFMFIGSEITELAWHDGVLDHEGEVTPYKMEKGVLSMEETDDDGTQLAIRFEKSKDPAPTMEEAIAWGEELNFEGMVDDFIDTENWGFEEETILVDTVEDFMNAIGDNHTIVLMPGEYNITAWLEEIGAERWDYKKFEKIAAGEYEGDTWIDYGIYEDSVHDGSQAIIYNIDDLTIMSADRNDPAVIVCEPRYADVMNFIDCDRLSLKHVVIGHTKDEGYCTGNVLSLTNCWEVDIENSELYGCGTYALNVSDCRDVRVGDCDIHDCTYGVAVAANTDEINFTYTDFHDCREFTMFEALTTDMTFIGCSFEKLDGDMVSIGDTESEVNFICCSFDKDAEASIEDNAMLDQQIFVY